jgi:hypothetical protein
MDEVGGTEMRQLRKESRAQRTPALDEGRSSGYSGFRRLGIYVVGRFHPAMALLAGWGRFLFAYFAFLALTDRAAAGIGPAGWVGGICCVLLMFVQRVSDDIRDFDEDVAAGAASVSAASRHPVANGQVSRGDLRRFLVGAAALVVLAHVPLLLAGHTALFAAAAVGLWLMTTDWSGRRLCPPSISAWLLCGYAAAVALADGGVTARALLTGGAAAQSLLVFAALWLPALTWHYSRKAHRWPPAAPSSLLRAWRVAGLAVAGAAAGGLVARWWHAGGYVAGAAAATSALIIVVCFIATRTRTIPARLLQATASLHVLVLLGLPPLSALLRST